MNIETFREYCLAKTAVTEDMPFDETTIAFRVGGKIFALTSTELPFNVNLKCDPEWAVQLREQHDAIRGGYHMNKKHWNTVLIDGSFPLALLQKMTDHSYDLVAVSLPKKIRTELGL